MITTYAQLLSRSQGYLLDQSSSKLLATLSTAPGACASYLRICWPIPK